MRVLFVNQTASVSGAERSLLCLLEGLRDRAQPEVACPPGPLADAVAQLGLPVHRLPGTDASFRLHPVHTPRALAELSAGALRVARLARQGRYAVVHANTTRAGLMAVGASRLSTPPVVAHVRDWVPPGQLSTGVLGVLRRGAAVVVANSDHVARQLPPEPRATPVVTVHNPVDLQRLDPARVPRAPARAALGLADGDLALGVIGQLTPWKGQEEAVRALALLAPRVPGARLLVVGAPTFAARSTRFDNRAYAERLQRLPGELGIADRVTFLGQREDVPEVLRALDLLLVPSWQEAFGRVAVEGMAMGVPVLATEVGGPAEIVRDGLEGRLLPPRAPEVWANAAEELLSQPDLRVRMGEAGMARARERFDVPGRVEEILEVYRQAISTRRNVG